MRFFTGIDEVDELVSCLDSHGQGGIPTGSICQIYGSSMSGKTTLLIRILYEILKKCELNKSTSCSIRMYICFTPGEILWTTYFRRLIESLLSRTKEKCNCLLPSHVNFIFIDHVNDILELLTHLKEAPPDEPNKVHNIIAIDSLGYVWNELLLEKRVMNEVSWYYLNMFSLLRSLCHAKKKSFTFFLTNCSQRSTKNRFWMDRIQITEPPAALGCISITHNIDYNFYLGNLSCEDQVPEEYRHLYRRLTATKGGNICFSYLPIKYTT